MCINFRMDEQFSVNPCNVNNGKELVLCITIWELLMDMMINRKNGYKGIHSISLHLYDAQAYGQLLWLSSDLYFAFNTGDVVPSLVRELRTHKLCSVAKIKKKLKIK